jgi:hypothetical protein
MDSGAGDDLEDGFDIEERYVASEEEQDDVSGVVEQLTKSKKRKRKAEKDKAAKVRFLSIPYQLF